MSAELYHYGVLGMKWGVRRYQNKDGTLTAAGKRRVAKDANEYYKRKRYDADREYQKFLEKDFIPVDAPLWDRYLNSNKPGNSDEWYKKNVPANSKYWDLKRRDDKLYNELKTYDRKAEATLAYLHHLQSNPIKQLSNKSPIINEGRQYVESYLDEISRNVPVFKQDLSLRRTESPRVAELKKRVTGKDSDGKPAFLMTEAEHQQFTKQYEANKQAKVAQWRKASDPKTKERLMNEIDQLENDYLSIVEQDFWYSDD